MQDRSFLFDDCGRAKIQRGIGKAGQTLEKLWTKFSSQINWRKMGITVRPFLKDAR